MNNFIIQFAVGADDGGCGTDTYFKWCSNGNSGIIGLVTSIFNILSVGVGLAAVISIIIGGVIYATSGANPENAKKGIKQIQNAGIALVLFAGFWAIMNFLIPGGLFN